MQKTINISLEPYRDVTDLQIKHNKRKHRNIISNLCFDYYLPSIFPPLPFSIEIYMHDRNSVLDSNKR